MIKFYLFTVGVTLGLYIITGLYFCSNKQIVELMAEYSKLHRKGKIRTLLRYILQITIPILNIKTILGLISLLLIPKDVIIEYLKSKIMYELVLEGKNV